MTPEEIEQARDVADMVLNDYDPRTNPGLVARAFLAVSKQPQTRDLPALGYPFLKREPQEAEGPTTTVEYFLVDACPLIPGDEENSLPDEYAALPGDFRTALIEVGKRPDNTRCARCNDPVGFVLHATPGGYDCMDWTPTGLARQTGRADVVALCGPCTPFIPEPDAQQASA